MKEFLIKNLDNGREMFMSKTKVLEFLPLKDFIMLTAEKKGGLYEIQPKI